MIRHLTRPRPWQPLSDDEWTVLAPYVTRATAGRPVESPRRRLDAIFWLATQRSYVRWSDLPEWAGKPDTVNRQFRRWLVQGLWAQLLTDLVHLRTRAGEVLRSMESWLCRTYRRGWRLTGLRGILFPKSLGLLSALRGPPWLLPDPELSAVIWPLLPMAVERPFRLDRIRMFKHLLTTIAGRGVPRHLDWP